MKCGNCKLWKTHDKKKQYYIFAKALGFCTCEYGNNYPMFNYERCPRMNRDIFLMMRETSKVMKKKGKKDKIREMKDKMFLAQSISEAERISKKYKGV